MLYVRKKDIENEKRVMRKVLNELPELKGILIKHNSAKTALFDFSGYQEHEFTYKHTHAIDVKVRKTKSDEYETVFLSKEKVAHFRTYPHIIHYMIYEFKDGKIVILDLSKCRLKPSTLVFTNQVTGEIQSNDVFEIDLAAKVFEL